MRVTRPHPSPNHTRPAHPGKALAPASVSDTCDAPCVDADKVERVRQALDPSGVIAAVAETFRILGDPTRMTIALALSREELCVCDLAALLGRSHSAVSHSLRALRERRLVRFRKEGRIAYYSLDDDHIAHLLEDGVRHVEADS